FHPGSPRFVSEQRAAEIVKALPESTCAVGVFVDRPPAEVARIADAVGLTIIQLHGDEPPEDILDLGRFQVIRAFRPRPEDGWRRVGEHLLRLVALDRPPWAVLVDAYVPGVAGGTGQAIDPRLLDSWIDYPRVILAGGLNPANVTERIAQVRPWMVDVASGVESAPGRKDLAAVAAFIRAAGRSSPG
ncbi:MAG: phosphoribosylanthranilate isomerase, partial [Isosphaeraceae bacterium]